VQITLDTSDPYTNFDTQIHVYTGSCGNLSCVASDDDSGFELTSLLTFSAQPYVNYKIRVGGFGAASGNFRMTYTVGLGGCLDPVACNYSPNADWEDCSCEYNPASFTLSGNASSSPGSYAYLGEGVNVVGYVQPGETIEFCGADLCNLTAKFFLGNDQSSWGGVTYSLYLHGNWYTGTAGDGDAYMVEIEFVSPECGCTDPTALNYDPGATEDSNMCEQNVAGSSCSNAQFVSVPSATLMNVSQDNLTYDDWFGNVMKSMWLEFEYTGGVISLEVASQYWGDPAARVYDSCNGELIFSGDDYWISQAYGSLNPRFLISCEDGLVKGETYLVQVFDLANTGNVVLDLRLKNFGGCTDPLAPNYDACANVDDGSCDTCPADLDNSGVVNVTDLLQFVSAYGTSCN
jgi:hypothetical protein